MAWAKWRHTLEESKRLAVKAIDEYNSSTGHYADFIGTMVRAWLYILQATAQRDKVDDRYKTRVGDFNLRGGVARVWEVGQYAKFAFPKENDPVRVNLELFILLRNKVEHRFEKALREVAGGRAHALVINYEQYLVGTFGASHSLANVLRFPLFVESITSTSKQPTLAATRALKAARTMLATFDAGLDDSILDDDRYDYRVRLIPTTSSKMSADAAYEFVDLAALSDDVRDSLTSVGRTGTVVTKMKTVSVGAKGTMLPSAVVAAVQKRVPYRFTVTVHTAMWKKFALHPSKWQEPDGGPTVQQYCVAIEPTRSYVFTQAWVERIVREIGTVEKFEYLLGHTPK